MLISAVLACHKACLGMSVLIHILLHLVQIVQEDESILVAIVASSEDISRDLRRPTVLLLLVAEENLYRVVPERDPLMDTVLLLNVVKAVLMRADRPVGLEQLGDLLLAHELVIGVEVDFGLALL